MSARRLSYDEKHEVLRGTSLARFVLGGNGAYPSWKEASCDSSSALCLDRNPARSATHHGQSVYIWRVFRAGGLAPRETLWWEKRELCEMALAQQRKSFVCLGRALKTGGHAATLNAAGNTGISVRNFGYERRNVSANSLFSTFVRVGSNRCASLSVHWIG